MPTYYFYIDGKVSVPNENILQLFPTILYSSGFIHY